MICGLRRSVRSDKSTANTHLVRPCCSAADRACGAVLPPTRMDANHLARLRSEEAGVMSQENFGQVALGAHVEVELVDETGASEPLTFDLVSDEQADFANGFLGAGTPLAQAIWGKAAGDTVAYRLGDVVSVRVMSVVAAARVQEEDVAAKRQAVIRQAVAESERISDMVFALAVGSKW